MTLGLDVTQHDEATAFGGPIDYLLVKLAARCNLNCSYCYWFTDPDVYRRDAVMGEPVAKLLVDRVHEQIRAYGLKHFKLLFHGGEPLLFKASRFSSLLSELTRIGELTDCEMHFSITTNGVLINDEWIEAFRRYNVRVTVSIDGPSDVHDRRRVDMQGRPTHAAVVGAIALLRERNSRFGVLGVCDPQSDPCSVVDYFVDELGIRDFNLLIPDAKHGDEPESIAPYYKALFEHVYATRARDRIRVTLLANIIRGLVGAELATESIGIGPIRTVTVLPDGELQALDVTRIAGDGFSRSIINLRDSPLERIKSDPLWRELYRAGVEHHPVCRACTWYKVCGAGHVSSRWREEGGFINPSVYCDDFKNIFDHMWNRVLSRFEPAMSGD